MNTRSIFKLFPLGLIAVSTLMVQTPANAMTVSGFTAAANVSDSACMDKWGTQVDNSCSRTIQVHFDVQVTFATTHYYAHVYAGSGQTITCWAESYNYAMNASYTGQQITWNGSGNKDLDLGAISTANTHNIVCNMGPGTAVHSVDGN